ncbi:MAG TPA: hypothetical protein PKJ51_10890 [Methanothrix sp.]|nr:hypothetical protein [Methanothrix sp.]
MEDRTQPEYNVADLLQEIEGLKAERDLFRDGFLRLYGAIARAHAAKGKAEKKDVAKYARIVEGLQPEDRPGYLATMGEVMIEALAETPATIAPEGPDHLRYDTRTLNQRRGEALAAHAQKTGKAAIKSTEAGTVLETVEGRKLDRKTVHRAMDVARGILRASSEVVGGIRRLVIPSPSPGGGEDRPQPFAVGGGGDRGGVSRPRRWAVPWDGVD